MFTAYIVDDEQISIDELLKSVPWMDNGIEVCGTNTNPRIALEEIMSAKPDVIFCDLMMPEYDGNDLIQKVREADIDAEFIMISAYDNFHDTRRFFRQEGLDYLLKPVQEEEMQIVLERLVTRIAKKKPVRRQNDETGTVAIFHNIAEYLKENYQKKITLELLSKQFGLSANYICNLFSDYFRQTLTSYLTELRMEAAGEQILGTSKAFKEIAIECGYTNYIYFCRVFKEYYKMTPSQYKNKGNYLEGKTI